MKTRLDYCTRRDLLAVYRALRDGRYIPQEILSRVVYEYSGNIRLRDSNFARYMIEQDQGEQLFFCERCGKLELRDNATLIDDEDLWCEACTNNYAFECDDCGSFYRFNTRIRTARGNYICRGCYENSYFTCENCGDVYPTDHYAEDGQCQDCFSPVAHCIYDYHQTTAQKVCGWGPKEWAEHSRTSYNIGLEIEFQHTNGFKGASEAIEEYLMPLSEGRAIWARDSSVAVELITRPTNRKELVSFLADLTHAKLHQKGFRVNTGAGLHINISRSAFKNDDGAARFDYAINRFASHTVAVSGRDRTDWAALDYARTIDRSLQALNGYEGKYRAVRWGRDRCEIRTPQSSTLGHILLSKVDYFLSLIEYANLPEDIPTLWDYRAFWNSALLPAYVRDDCAPSIHSGAASLFSFVNNIGER
jgi:hypothetical protein